eukprot:Pompholyxophrys_punicea_v1_NODE_170_length_3030_cov_11.943193.p3 type:complete len:101 gc:universal NODE_170_length_3030_cov_11.943193:733-431(-)
MLCLLTTRIYSASPHPSLIYKICLPQILWQYRDGVKTTVFLKLMLTRLSIFSFTRQKMLSIHRPRLHEFSLDFEGLPLHSSSSTRFLGVYFHSHLTWFSR